MFYELMFISPTNLHIIYNIRAREEKYFCFFMFRGENRGQNHTLGKQHQTLIAIITSH